MADGRYDVFVGGKKAKIEVKRERNLDALQKIFHRFVPLTPLEEFDIHGIINIYHITMELMLPFALVNNTTQTDDIKSECLKYLNRLIEVVRYKTRKYWLLPVSNNELLYADISNLVDASGKGKGKEGYINMSSFSVLNMSTKNESEVQSSQLCMRHEYELIIETYQRKNIIFLIPTEEKCTWMLLKHDNYYKIYYYLEVRLKGLNDQCLLKLYAIL